MKTRNQNRIIAIFAICIIAVFTSCNNDVTPAHVHQFSADWKKDATQHWHECSCGEKADIANHTWGNWTVTTPANETEEGEETRTCATCGATETQPVDKLSHVHQWGNWEQTKAPSVTEEGEQERTCATCGEKETQPIAKLQSIIEMVQVAGGTFQMGKDLGTAATGDETPVHNVTLTGFNMGKYPVTQAQWYAVMGKTIVEQQALAVSSTTDYGRGDNYPMYCVSWYDALVFCNKLSVMEGLTPAYSINNSTDPSVWGTVPTSNDDAWDEAVIVAGSTGYRLPTEAQWEYAAKGGNPSAEGWTGYTYSGSDTIGDVAWYGVNNGSPGNSNYGTKEVGTKAPNGLGLYDMSGNVFEWCWDWYGSYPSGDQTDPTGIDSGSNRVIRGGSWGSNASSARCAFRYYYYPYIRDGSLGFRLARP